MNTLFIAMAMVFLSNSAHATTCGDLRSCAKAVSDITDHRYIWDPQHENTKFSSVPEIDINKENAEIVFTALLDQAGLARMPVGDGKSFRIVKNVMMKEIEAPVLDASFDYAPKLGKTWDWVTMRYKAKNPDSVYFMERSYRLHLPREARMQADGNAGLLIVTGPTPVVRQMYETLKAADKPMSAISKKLENEKTTQ